ncbi:Ubiquitin-like modifier-activating enzyme atg7 [Fusarium oxysporum]|uniref:Ubiquitin-like modifier-activating enzyme ATG7 n=1 Tax=Fusarium oxysporum TaxID=5507 RepID=A0A420RZK8_FUSOX|nr:Ubiquitin-like modifier-activating enzyme atg7 [Fusarium oxysporum]
MAAPLQFAPFISEIELSFYSALFGSKLEHDKLDDSARSILGLYEPRLEEPESSCRMQILGNALTSSSPPLGTMRAEGIIRNVNTLEDFKNTDKPAMLKTAGRQFTYWFAFPALHSDPSWKRSGPAERLNSKESTALVDRVGTWRYSVDSREHGFFLVKKVHGEVQDTDDPDSSQGLPFRWEVASLREFENGFFDQVAEEDRYVAFVDPSTYPEGPGWPLRNFLVLIRQRFHLTKTKVICYRDIQAKRHEARSVILPIEMDPVENLEITEMPKVTGWARSSNGKLQAQQVNLGEYMDPARQADGSVDLNLKLMKWRIAPELDLDAIKNTKCLLLGAGTLGSYVSRNLMGWGVRKITFVDYGRVSFSNPVRQPLFNFQDCLEGGKPKAPRAAEALKEIYPGIDSEGHTLFVPMLGHPYIDESKTREEYEKLEKLIDEHDAIFLLMDSRESRWLPTVMGKAKGKIVMNAALGFDSYVVMRHGSESHAEGQTPLGCYFCNDVVAPADDQTLDQQCTVTRPGVAAIASALLVELLTSLLQHPLGKDAPAPQPTPGVVPERDPPEHPLGLVPHQIRGYVSTFQNIVIRGQSYDCCSACSPKILDAYRNDGWGFVKKALQEKDYVAELSGLAEVQRRAEEMAAQVDWEEDDDLVEDGDGELI